MEGITNINNLKKGDIIIHEPEDSQGSSTTIYKLIRDDEGLCLFVSQYGEQTHDFELDNTKYLLDTEETTIDIKWELLDDYSILKASDKEKEHIEQEYERLKQNKTKTNSHPCCPCVLCSPTPPKTLDVYDKYKQQEEKEKEKDQVITSTHKTKHILYAHKFNDPTIPTTARILGSHYGDYDRYGGKFTTINSNISNETYDNLKKQKGFFEIEKLGYLINSDTIDTISIKQKYWAYDHTQHSTIHIKFKLPDDNREQLLLEYYDRTEDCNKQYLELIKKWAGKDIPPPLNHHTPNKEQRTRP